MTLPAPVTHPITYLIYTSKSAVLMQQEGLTFLLAQSRKNNLSFHITGMLIYMEGRFLDKLEGRFMQFIEGDQADINALYERILKDERHHAVLLLEKGSCAQRNFENWSMGFQSLEKRLVLDASGYFELADCFSGIGTLSCDKRLLNYFKVFYQINNCPAEF